MVTFQKYQLSALQRLKVGFYWVLMIFFYRTRNPSGEVQWYNFSPRLCFMKTLFSVRITPKAKDLNNTQQRCAKNPEAFTNIWTGGCQWHLHLAYLEKQFHRKRKEVIRLDVYVPRRNDRCFPNPQPMKFNCSKLFNLKTDVGTSNQRFKTINQKVEYQQFDWRKRALKDNWGVYRSGCPYDFQHFYLLQVTSKVRKGSD